MPDVQQQIRTFYSALDRRDWEVALSVCDPEVEYTPVEENVVCCGRDELLRYFERWWAGWEDEHVAHEEIDVVSRQDKVVVAMRFTGRGRGSEVPVEGLFFHVIGLREGRLHRIAEYLDRAEAREAYDALR